RGQALQGREQDSPREWRCHNVAHARATPWDRGPTKELSPERAEQREVEGISVSPLQGSGLGADGVPRALPWAGLLRPFGARTRYHAQELLKSLHSDRQRCNTNG